MKQLETSLQLYILLNLVLGDAGWLAAGRGVEAIHYVKQSALDPDKPG